MTLRAAMLPLLAAALFVGACSQQAGDVCQRYPAGGSDCGEGLECCGEARTCDSLRTRGVCVATGTCPETTPLMCDDDDAGTTDAGDTDAGEGVDAGGGVDAGSDAGSDAGNDAGSDAGTDAGTDAGSDAGTDAGTDAG